MNHKMIPAVDPYPAVDRNNPEKAKGAIMLEWPDTFSDRAKKVIQYLDGTAFLYFYYGRLVVTDESMELTAYGDGSYEAPIGFPLWEGESLDELEKWLEDVADQYDADGDILGWGEG